MYSIKAFALLAGLASAACPRVQIIALGGQGTTVGDLGYLNTTIAAIQGAIPNTELFQIGYPVGAEDAAALASGVPQLQAHLTSFTQKCPNTKLVTVGYSIGGAAVMNVFCGDAITGADRLAESYRHNLLANIIYGDPTFIPGLRYDVGSCVQNGETPRTYPGQCYPFSRKTKSYCLANDAVCCSGDDTPIHFTYPQVYDGDAAAWVKAKHAYWINHRTVV